MNKILLLLLSFFSFSIQAGSGKPDIDNFVKETASQYDLDEKFIKDILLQAKRQQSIIDAMNRPAEKKKKWFEYRKIFITDKRINKGVEFWNEHKETLNQVSKETGVPVEIIVAIIGVETYYGAIKGNYKVIDALYTLAFHYPKRSEFFTKELGKFMLLTNKEKISALETKGSYAGAMGFGQFMPSSYLQYAVDFDKDGQRDLINNIPDAIASVGNYLKSHGWEKNKPVAFIADAEKGHTSLKKQALKPSLTVKQLNDYGYKTEEKLDADEMISLTQLQQKNHMEYWFGLNNFYVITRYNHSEMYAMAVYQLAQKIKHKMSQSK